MRLVVVSRPTEPPVPLFDVLAQLRLDVGEDDVRARACADAARDHLEGTLGRALAPQRLQYALAAFPRAGSPIPLPRPPLTAVDSVEYWDDAGLAVVLPEFSGWVIDDTGYLAELRPPTGRDWPSARLAEASVRITYDAGYTGTAGLRPMPEALRQALLLQAEQFYDGHERHAGAISALIAPYQVWSF